MIGISLTSRKISKCALTSLSTNFESICELAHKFETIFVKNAIIGEDFVAKLLC
jgi:hypothetical protein